MWYFCQNQYSGSQAPLPTPHLSLLFLAAYLHVSFPAGKVNKWVCLVRVLFAKVLSCILVLLLFLPAQPTTLETPGACFYNSAWICKQARQSCVTESLCVLALIRMENPCQKKGGWRGAFWDIPGWHGKWSHLGKFPSGHNGHTCSLHSGGVLELSPR